MKFNYFVEDDNGNSEKKITINGEMMKFPNTYSYVYKEPVPQDKKIEELVHVLIHNMDVTVNSSALKGQVAQRVFVGERAIRSGEDLQNLNIKSNSGKHRQDTTLMTTVSAIAWHLDETYIKVKGEWCYLYRAIDGDEHTLDIQLRKTRDHQGFWRTNGAYDRQGSSFTLCVQKITESRLLHAYKTLYHQSS